MKVVFVHGACVRDGSWWWGPTGRLLDEVRVSSIAAALPSCGEAGHAAGPDGPGLKADVAAVRDVLGGVNEPTVVVAHSYGGIVVAKAAAGIASVQKLVLVSSYLPEVGQSLSDFGNAGPAPFLDVDPGGGVFSVRPELLVETFLHDCSPEIQAQGPEHLAEQTLRVTSEPVGAAAWKHVPSTYVVCASDRGTSPRLQREYALRADTVVELDAGHHPFLSQPAVFCDLVLSS